MSGSEKADRRSQQGISLLEMAVFLIVIGLMAMGGFKLYETKVNYQRTQQTAEKLAKIKEAIEAYRRANKGALPCVSPLTAGPDDPVFGRPTKYPCTAVTGTPGTFSATGFGGRGVKIGALPVRALGLPDDYMVDGWGNRIVYAVTKIYAINNPPPFKKPALTLLDLENNPVSSSIGGIVYLAFSPGVDTRGAYNINGRQIRPCEENTLAGENCNNDATFKTSLVKDYSGDDKLTSLFIFGSEGKSVVSNRNRSQGMSSMAGCQADIQISTADCMPAPAPSSGMPGSYQLKGGFVYVMHEFTCPDRKWINRGQVGDACIYGPPGGDNTNNNGSCVPTSRTRPMPCPQNPPASTGLPPTYVYISGSITQKSDYTCPSGQWGDWYDSQSTCTWAQGSPTDCEVQGSCSAKIGYQVSCDRYVLLETDCPNVDGVDGNGKLVSGNPVIDLQLQGNSVSGQLQCSQSGIPACGLNTCTKAQQSYDICVFKKAEDNPNAGGGGGNNGNQPVCEEGDADYQTTDTPADCSVKLYSPGYGYPNRNVSMSGYITQVRYCSGGQWSGWIGNGDSCCVHSGGQADGTDNLCQ